MCAHVLSSTLNILASCKALLTHNLLLELEDIVVEELVQFLISEVDAELLKRVPLH